MSALFAVGTLSAATGCSYTRTCTKVATATSVASVARASRAAQTCGATSCNTRASRNSLVPSAARSSATRASCDGMWRRTMPVPRRPRTMPLPCHQVSCECGVGVNLLDFTNACMISSGPISKHLSLHSRFAMCMQHHYIDMKALIKCHVEFFREVDNLWLTLSILSSYLGFCVIKKLMFAMLFWAVSSCIL